MQSAFGQAAAASTPMVSPFAYAEPFVMATSRAAEVGYSFGDSKEWVSALAVQAAQGRKGAGRPG